MKVCVYTVQKMVGSTCGIKELITLLDPAMPKPLPLEGGNMKGPMYLICVSENVDVHKICGQVGWLLYPGCHGMDVEDSTYNNMYQIVLNYGKHVVPYELEKMNN